MAGVLMSQSDGQLRQCQGDMLKLASANIPRLQDMGNVSRGSIPFLDLQKSDRCILRMATEVLQAVSASEQQVEVENISDFSDSL